MNRVHVLRMLLQHGPLFYAELREITGWSEGRLARGLEVARAPRGPVRRDLVDGRWLYRLASPEERDVPIKPRGVMPGSTWTRARREAEQRRRMH